ncbi:hypothetical protein [Paenibacillus paeoniae]|uniref:Uncharacterized protein n=1 Tax=Paenibacillus paeoniae TaxID=2292705 RepID=A0A371PH48_9BACL|nr:hypothetical protein [Paenibacillus paeoniae]REK75185.1 hypothetical protein DX130_16290 [Paenibacillus paeoniae]
MNKKFIIFGGIIVVAIILQFINVGLVGNSVVSNIPVLGELLTLIDFLFIFDHLNQGLTISNMQQFLLRVVSLIATLYTAIKINDLGLNRFNEFFGDERIIKYITIVAAIVIHMVIYFIFHKMYIETIFALLHRITDELNKINELLTTF